MPRAHRHFVPGLVWHITHRCHHQEFLLKFSRDRDRYLWWLMEAKRRYGLCVLNYVITCNHVHVLAREDMDGAIARGMQLVAGRTAQEFNARKERRGAFWEDRYHATAVDSGDHLVRCITYIDLNMVRAGAVRHPMWWRHGGYTEIQNPPQRYRLIDTDALVDLVGAGSLTALQAAQRQWASANIAAGRLQREPDWSEALAIGSPGFAERVKTRLAGRTDRRRTVTREQTAWVVREPVAAYGPTPPETSPVCALQATWRGLAGAGVGASLPADIQACRHGSTGWTLADAAPERSATATPAPSKTPPKMAF
jgi:putative transposase